MGLQGFIKEIKLKKSLVKIRIIRVPGKNLPDGVPIAAQWLTNPTRNHEVAGSVPALAQWVNDPALPWWCRSQTRLGSHVTVALA